LEKSRKEKETYGLMRNAKRSQGRKMRYIGKFSRDERGHERKSKSTNEELRKEYTNVKSGFSVMRK
jgi:hypothetical protein